MRNQIYKNNSGGYYEEGFRGPKRFCDVCGLTFYQEDELKLSKGVYKCTVGPTCIDDDYEDHE